MYCEFDYRPPQLAGNLLAHLVLVPNPPHNPAGDFALDGATVLAEGDERWTFSGISVLHPDLFAAEAPGKFPLAPLLVDAMAGGCVTGEVFKGRWIDVGTPDRLHELDVELAGRM